MVYFTPLACRVSLCGLSPSRVFIMGSVVLDGVTRVVVNAALVDVRHYGMTCI